MSNETDSYGSSWKRTWERVLRPPPLGAESPLDLLLVEDNPDASEMLAGLLEIRGHSVMSVERAESALEFLQVHKPDLIHAYWFAGYE